ncbi:MAG: CARDB domain-containing protein, partial [Candidatus Dormibacteraceae bacterium]
MSNGVPDDPAYPAYRIPFYTSGYSYRICGQVWIFQLCFSAGVGASAGIEARFGGLTDPNATANSTTNDPTVFVKVGPYADVSAYIEGSIGFFCVDLALRLEGDFLHVSIPVRMDMDLQGTVVNGQATPNLYLAADESITPWELRLIGRFDYCVGSASKTLWTDSANASTKPLLTYCVNKPDLTVTVLTTDPASGMDTSAPLSFYATVQNVGIGATPPSRPVVATVAAGSAFSSSFRLMLADGSTPRQLKPGASYKGRVVWSKPVVGTYSVATTVNPDAINGNRAAIDETTLANNVLTTALTVKPAYPDLVVKSAEVLVPTKVQGDTAQLRITIANLGPGPNPTTPDKEWGDVLNRWVTTNDPIQVHYRVLSGTTVLNEGDAFINGPVTASFPTTLNGVLIKSVSVDVDSPNAVKEKDETNNRM